MARIHTHYDNLKVARNAPLKVIRAAYKALSQEYHPDRNPGDVEAARIMPIINASYDVLSDPEKRREYDLWIEQQERGKEQESVTSNQSKAAPAPSPLALFLRWIAMIPVAVVGYIAVYTIVFWIATWNLTTFTSVPPELARISAACSGGAAFVFVGTAVAPLYRGFAAIALLSLNAVVLSVGLVLYLQGQMDPRPMWEVLVDFFGGLFGAGATLFWVLKTLGWSKTTRLSSMWREYEQ